MEMVRLWRVFMEERWSFFEMSTTVEITLMGYVQILGIGTCRPHSWYVQGYVQITGPICKRCCTCLQNERRWVWILVASPASSDSWISNKMLVDFPPENMFSIAWLHDFFGTYDRLVLFCNIVSVPSRRHRPSNVRLPSVIVGVWYAMQTVKRNQVNWLAGYWTPPRTWMASHRPRELMTSHHVN